MGMNVINSCCLFSSWLWPWILSKSCRKQHLHRSSYWYIQDSKWINELYCVSIWIFNRPKWKLRPTALSWYVGILHSWWINLPDELMERVGSYWFLLILYLKWYVYLHSILLAICPPGQNPNLTDTSQCIDCKVGYFSSVNASDQCTLCHSNYTTPSTGSTMEEDCKSKNFYLCLSIKKQWEPSG